MTTVANTTDKVKKPDNKTVYFKPYAELSILEVADAEKYADYETKIRFVDHKPVKVRRSPDDDELAYRFPGTLWVLPGRKEFRIDLWPGATLWDVRQMRRTIADVKAGYFARFPFVERDSTVTPGFKSYGFHPGFPVEAARPRGPLQYNDYVVQCTEPACDKFSTFHTTDSLEDTYVAHTIAQFKSDNWEISLIQEPNSFDPKDRRPWRVNMYVPDCAVPAERAAALASDLQWAVAECNQLNSRAGVLV